MGDISTPVRLALNMSVHLGPKASVQSYYKVKRVSTPNVKLRYKNGPPSCFHSDNVLEDPWEVPDELHGLRGGVLEEHCFQTNSRVVLD